MDICMIIVFILMLFPMKSVAGDSSSDSETVVSLPCSRRYLSESYFAKHDSLTDFDFQGYLAHELPLCGSNQFQHYLNYVPRLSDLQRDLVGEGSHRHLSSTIKLRIQQKGTLEPPAHFCHAIVIERLPSGVFADPFELQHIVQRGVFTDAAVFGDTNLELPTALSNRSVVEIHMDIGQNYISANEKELEINVDLPLHARYPALDSSGYSEVEMGMPDVLMRCSFKEKSEHNNCVLTTMPEMIDSNTSAPVWRIPSGNAAHSGLVSATTFFSALLFALVIVLTAIYSPNAQFMYTWSCFEVYIFIRGTNARYSRKIQKSENTDIAEIPQEVGDFGILVRSGFSVSKALFFNFLSALVALAGTALALLLGQDPGQSSLIEGFTAGGFIYIAVAGVLSEMNSGKLTFRSTAVQLTSLISGMAVALYIALVE